MSYIRFSLDFYLRLNLANQTNKHNSLLIMTITEFYAHNAIDGVYYENAVLLFRFWHSHENGRYQELSYNNGYGSVIIKLVKLYCYKTYDALDVNVLNSVCCKDINWFFFFFFLQFWHWLWDVYLIISITVCFSLSNLNSKYLYQLILFQDHWTTTLSQSQPLQS